MPRYLVTTTFTRTRTVEADGHVEAAELAYLAATRYGAANEELLQVETLEVD